MLKAALSVVVFLMMLQSKLTSAETFTVVSDYWCPYNCEPNAEPEGFGIDILRQAFEAKGITVEYILRLWNEALAVVESNQFHAVMSANKTDSRKLLYPDSYFSRSTTCFFKQKNNDWSFNGVQSLKYVQLGVIKSYSYGALLDKYLAVERNNIHWVSGSNPLDRLLVKMKAGEIDVIIEDKHVFQYQVSSSDSSGGFKTDYCLPPANIYMAFAPNHPDTQRYMEIYNQRMKALLKGETYKVIMRRYK